MYALGWATEVRGDAARIFACEFYKSLYGQEGEISDSDIRAKAFERATSAVWTANEERKKNGKEQIVTKFEWGDPTDGVKKAGIPLCLKRDGRKT